MESTKGNILITNYHCASNRGDAAILEGISTTLNNHLPGNQTVLTEYPNSSTYINNMMSLEQRTAAFRPDRPTHAAAYLADLFHVTSLSDRVCSWVEKKLNLEPYCSSDIIIGTGGHYLTEIYYPAKLGVLWELSHCKDLGKPVILCGQSFGPIESTPYKKVTRRVMNKLDAITVRDSDSKRHLESLGITTDIYQTADLAFAMDLNDSNPLSTRRLEALPSLKGEPVFTISVRDWSHFNQGGMSQYLEGIASLCEMLVNEYNGSVYFLSTCTGFDGYHTDDRVTSHQVCDKLLDNVQDDVHIVTGEYTPQELVTLFKNVDLHIGTRMHSLVLALLAETPVVGIEYQFKTSGLMSMFDLDEYVLPIEETTSESLRALFEKAYTNIEEIDARIERNLPLVRKQAEQNGRIVAEVFEDYS